MEQIQRPISEFLKERSWPELAPTASVADALEAMNRTGLDCVLIVEDERLTGIFTGRDFLHRIAAERRPPGDVRLADVMTPEPEVLKRHYDVCYAINRMAVRAIRRLPVVDDERRPVGLLMMWDVIAHLDDVFDDLLGDPPDPPTADLWLDLGGG